MCPWDGIIKGEKKVAENMWVTVSLSKLAITKVYFFGSPNVCRVKAHGGVDGERGTT